MKQFTKSFAVFALCLCLLAGGFAVAAEKYSFVDGKVPDNWTQITDESDVTATDILTPVNPNASQEAKNLYAYLCTLANSDAFLTGQFDIGNSNKSYETVTKDFGFEPALYSARYVVNTGGDKAKNYSITRTGETEIVNGKELNKISYPDDLMLCTPDSVEKVNRLMKQHYDNGNVLLIHSDSANRDVCAYAAMERGKYESKDDVIMELDVTNPDRDLPVYALWYRYQTDVMTHFKEMEDMGVKAYLWRPWIEFNLSGFNGATDEGKASFVRVFQQTVQRMIDFGLTGFLVTYSPSGGNNTIQMNPGNDYIDSYAITVYSETSALGHIAGQNLRNYYWYAKTGKPIGFSEFSCRTGDWKNQGKAPRASSFDLLADAIAEYPALAWINFWGDGSYSLQNSDKAMAAGNDDGRLFMDSPYTLSLEEIPDYRTTKFIAPGVAQVRLKGEAAGVYHGLEERDYSLAELQAMGIDPTKVESVRANTDYGITFFTEDNCGGTAYGYVGGAKNLASATVAQFRSCRIEAVQNLALDKDSWASDNDDIAYKANDGLLSLWEGRLSADGTAWLYVDLNEPCTISKFIVRNAGATQRPDMYNTRGFQIQYSNDAKSWTTVSEVKDNDFSVVTRTIQPVTARYFRILITEANHSSIESEKDVVMISELELYGVIHGISQTADEEPDNDDGGDDVIEPVIDTDDGGDDDGETSDTSDDTPNNGGKKRRVIRKVVTSSNTWIIIVCVAAGVVLLGGGTGLFIFLRKRKRSGNTPQ